MYGTSSRNEGSPASLALAKSHESYTVICHGRREAAKQYRIEIELQMQQPKNKVNHATKLLKEAEKQQSEEVDDDEQDRVQRSCCTAMNLMRMAVAVTTQRL